MHVFRIFAACVVLAVSATAGSAENVKVADLVSGNWKGGAYIDRDTGRLSHCGLYGSYRSGISVHFFVDATYDWSIGFAGAGALVPQQRYPVAYTIDGGPVNRLSGIAREGNFLRADLPDNAAIFDQFRYGEMLSVSIQGSVHRFRLTGTAKALSMLVDCVAAHSRTAGTIPRPEPSKPSESSKPSAVPQARAITADDRLDAVRFVANLFAKTEMRDYRFMTADELADKRWPEIARRSDVAWVSKDEIGFLHIFSTDALPMDDALAAAIGSDAKSCQGDFASGKLTEPGSDLKRVFTVCKDAKSPFSVEYFFIPRKSGLAYRFATYRFDAARPDTKPLGEALKSI